MERKKVVVAMRKGTRAEIHIAAGVQRIPNATRRLPALKIALPICKHHNVRASVPSWPVVILVLPWVAHGVITWNSAWIVSAIPANATLGLLVRTTSPV